MAAALVVLMVDCCNRHDTDALAACYAPDTWVHPLAGRRRSTPGPGWPPSASSWPPSPTCGSIRATWAANGRVALRLGLVQRVAQVEAEGAGISNPISPNRLYDPQDRPCGRPPSAGQGHPRQTLDVKR